MIVVVLLKQYGGILDSSTMMSYVVHVYRLLNQMLWPCIGSNLFNLHKTKFFCLRMCLRQLQVQSMRFVQFNYHL
jgi:hypothetical protein